MSFLESEFLEVVESVFYFVLLFFFMEMELIFEDYMFYKNSEGSEGNNYIYVCWYLKCESCL